MPSVEAQHETRNAKPETASAAKRASLMPSFCSNIARDRSDVGIHGSATVAPHWLCIEHPDPWAARELKNGSLPPRLTAHIWAWKKTVPGLRPQGIRREVRTWDRPGQVTVLLASANIQPSGAAPILWRARLDTYDDIAALDVPRLVEAARRGETNVLQAAGFEQATDPVVLTCTNGKRDACCALKGRPFHDALADIAPRAAWQTTHLGGHRFAPTAVVLPDGSQYGWLSPGDAPGLWTAARQKQIFRLDRYRGCTAYARPVQAAAIALRQHPDAEAQYLGVRGLRIDEVEREGEDRWTVRLLLKEVRATVTVRRHHGDPVPASCSGKTKPTVRYEANVE